MTELTSATLTTTSEQWLTLAKTLQSCYPNPNFLSDEGKIKVWYTMLRNIPYAALANAVGKWISNNKFPPTIAELRSLAEDSEVKPVKMSKEMQEYVAQIHRWWDEMDAQIAEQNLEKEMGIYEARL